MFLVHYSIFLWRGFTVRVRFSICISLQLRTTPVGYVGVGINIHMQQWTRALYCVSWINRICFADLQNIFPFVGWTWFVVGAQKWSIFLFGSRISEGHIFSTTGLYKPLSLSNVSGASDIFATLVMEKLPEHCICHCYFYQLLRLEEEG